MKISILISLLVLSLIAFAKGQDGVSELFPKDVCADRVANLKCDTNYTPIVVEASYGISQVESQLCDYNQNDCFEAAPTDECSYPGTECSVYGPVHEAVTTCQNHFADYMHIRYRCAPINSPTLRDYKICDEQGGDITDLKGFVSSANYPDYTIQYTQCTRKISVPNNKVVNMYIYNDFKIPESYNDCKEDYLKITDNTGTYTTCGYRKYAFESQFCSSVLYLSYRAPANLSTAYRGFKLYYETVDRSTQPNCPTVTPLPPTQPSIMTTQLPAVDPLLASDIKKETICKGSGDLTINTPARFSLFPISYYYGVTSDFTCNTIGPQNCRSPAPFACSTQGTCKISLTTNVVLNDCAGKVANYIGIEYRFLPLATSYNFSVCDNTEINATQTTAGVITSPNYPNWQPSQNCNRKIVAQHGRSIRVYVTDISIDRPENNLCQNGYLRFSSDCGEKTYCGDKSSGGSFVFETCSSTLLVTYVSSSTNNNAGFRGFNIYYEVGPADQASVVLSKSACAGQYVIVECPPSLLTNFTVFTRDAYYGVKPGPSTNSCQYSADDCFEVSTDRRCPSATDNDCYIFTYEEDIYECNNRPADYFYFTYRCIPAFSNAVNNYNICDRTLSVITDASAFISSPNYPTYIQVMEDCTQKIVAPRDKVIKMWIASDMQKSNFNDECVTDYIKITDNTGTYSVCGYRKFTFENKFCSSVIYITYKAPEDLSSAYSGFRLYYEFVDRSSQPECPTNTPEPPSTPIPTTTSPYGIFDSQATVANKIYICRGNITNIKIPDGYKFFPTDVYYGVSSSSSSQCEISSSDCTSPTTVSCSVTGTCTLSFLTDVTLSLCGGKLANYIGLEYRLVPFLTAKNYSACDGVLDIYFKKGDYGILTSSNYPQWQANQNCFKRINSQPGTIIRVYLTDLSIEDREAVTNRCQKEYLKFDSDNGGSVYCGEKSNFVYETPTNVLGIEYLTSASGGEGKYRGFNFYFEIVTSGTTSLLTHDVCAGESDDLICDSNSKTNYTLFVSEAIYGVSAYQNKTCEYTTGDCYDAASVSFCTSLQNTCYIYSYSFTTVKNCENNKADYFHLRYRCIPASSSVITSYDICSNQMATITDSSAFIRSPNFPTYTQILNDCVVKIVAPSNKVIRLWLFTDMKYSYDICTTDYVMITDSTASYKVCGYNKASFDLQLCSSVIYVSYRAETDFATYYQGFQIYYEFADRADASPDCPTNTPATPTTPAPVTRTTTAKPFGNNLASEFYRKFVCKGSQMNIDIPAGSSLAIINSYYGTTPDYTCNTINPQNCISPVTLNCPSQGTCTVAFYSDIPIDDCNGLIAHYIGVEYRFIPLYSSANYTVCSNDNIDANKTRAGIITSPGYPNFLQNQNCRRTIVAPARSYIRVFVTDLNIEPAETNGDCQNGYLKFSTSCGNDVQYCGSKTSSNGFEFVSCGNTLTILYGSSSNSNSAYRGFNVYYEVTMPDIASNQQEKDLCKSDSSYLICEKSSYTNFTVVVNEAVLGVKELPSNKCGLTVGDCYVSSQVSYCYGAYDSCYVYAPSSTLIGRCQNQYADYLHLRYKCVPFESHVISNYNICDKFLKNITESSAFISSPGFPTYNKVEQECSIAIVVPSDRIINIWISSMDIKNPESNNDCVTDYVKITHNTGTTKVCGYRKYSYDNKLCSSVIYLSYKAMSPNNYYKGFRLYYETLPRSSQPNCPTGTPAPPYTGPSTTASPALLDQATPLTKTYVCKGDGVTIDYKPNYVLFPIDVYYGVTSDGKCDTISPKDCRGPAALPESCFGNNDCELQLYNEIPVDDCSGSIASYVFMEYRYVPEFSQKNYSICSHEAINTTYGVITSPNYPQWLPNQRCRTVINAPEDKVIRVYITRINLEPEDETYGNCTQSHLSFITGNIVTRYCGKKVQSGNYIFSSCSNTLEIGYYSSAIISDIYNGFNIYFEVVDKVYINCPNSTRPTFTSRTTRHVTIIQNDHKHTSNKLIGWSLGLGIPLFLILILGVFFCIKRVNGGADQSSSSISFSKMKNSDIEDSKTYKNPNY